MENLNNKIAQLNDECRQSGGRIGRLMLTSNLDMQITPNDKAKIYGLVATYSDFNEENDPYSEHDMGLFKFKQHSLYWKIDCYDNNLEYGSEDPSNSEITTRVLTIMLASDY
ncbi:MAG: DUF3768 domain-containing protein [Rhizobiales bacterium]|nr:DUF3768 domain-containing protein [Hyphomicrobiales bacterium]